MHVEFDRPESKYACFSPTTNHVVYSLSCHTAVRLIRFCADAVRTYASAPLSLIVYFV